METHQDRRRERIRRRRRVVILLFFVGLVVALLYLYRAVLAPFLVALFVAYLIAPLVERMAPIRLVGRLHLGRAGAIIVLYLLFLVTIYLGGTFAIPAVGRQLRQAQQDLPRLQRAVETQIERALQKWSEWTGERDAKPGEPATAPAAPGGGDSQADQHAPVDGSADGQVEPVLVDPDALPVPEETGPPHVRFHLRGGGVIEGWVPDRNDRQAVVRLGDRFEVLDLDRVDHEEVIRSGGQTPGSIRKMVEQGVSNAVGHLNEVLGLAIQFVWAVVGALYKVVLIMMITAFLVIDQKRILDFLKKVPPQRTHKTVNKLVEYIDRGLAGVIRGQLIICAVNALLTWAGLAMFDIRYAGLLGLIAGIFSLIPIFGTILSTVPIVLVAWGAGSIEQGALALGWVLLIHFLEANFLNPKIMGSASKIHPVVIIFALLAGEHAYGLVGALLAVPTVSILQSSFKFYVLDRQAETEEGNATQAAEAGSA